MADRMPVHEPFADEAQQREAGVLGMYLFLATEVMLFGGLFVAAAVVRVLHPPAFAAASAKLQVAIGGVNTAVLLTSSLLVALAVAAADRAAYRRAAGLLAGAAAWGLVFLAGKGIEYDRELHAGLLPVPGVETRFADPVEQLFMNLYLLATGLHALHVVVGVLLLAVLAWRAALAAGDAPGPVRGIELGGLFWHLVDVIWIFLYPTLYLAR